MKNAEFRRQALKDETRLMPLSRAELDRANAVIEAAIMSWDLPMRVKRLSLPSYRYHEQDLDHLVITAAVDARDRVLGVATWEPAEPDDGPSDRRAMLLHGIYVEPAAQGAGLGTRLLRAAAQAAHAAGFDGLLVKASRHAQGFFAARGLTPLPVEDRERDYPYRYWMDLALSSSGTRGTGGGAAAPRRDRASTKAYRREGEPPARPVE